MKAQKRKKGKKRKNKALIRGFLRFFKQLTFFGRCLFLFGILVLLLIAFCLWPRYDGIKGEEAAKEVLEIFLEEGYTKEAACAMIGNMSVESGVCPCIRQGYKAYDRESRKYTKEVDEGQIDRESFMHDSVGYGLIGFTYYTLKERLYDQAQTENGSIGDLDVQTRAVIRILKEDCPDLDESFRTSADLSACCKSFAYRLEKSAALLGQKGEKARLSSEQSRISEAERYFQLLS